MDSGVEVRPWCCLLRIFHCAKSDKTRVVQQFAYISNRIKCIKVMTGNGPFLA
jgi:hypothetical protein